MCHFPGVTNASSFAIQDSFSMNRICVFMIENKDVVIAMTGRDWKFTSLIGIGFNDFLMGKKHGAELMALGGKRWC